MIIDFPWPDKLLSPNSRAHWAPIAKAKKSYRHACWALTIAARAQIDWPGVVHLHVTFYPPARYGYDDDNLVGRFKSGRDGIADALGINDKRFRVHPLVSTETGGFVRVNISQHYEEQE